MDLILMMKNELMLVAIIVILLIMKVADNGKSNSMWIGVINVLLIVNCIVDWLPVREGELFWRRV
ncbi:MAG: hypothetical protein IPN61_02615 [Bacteroidetes bacterium]|nr:hypothetical protein [Bacteroidota bacterium]